MEANSMLDSTINGFIVSTSTKDKMDNIDNSMKSKEARMENKMAANEKDDMTNKEDDKPKQPRLYFPIKVKVSIGKLFINQLFLTWLSVCLLSIILKISFLPCFFPQIRGHFLLIFNFFNSYFLH